MLKSFAGILLKKALARGKAIPLFPRKYSPRDLRPPAAKPPPHAQNSNRRLEQELSRLYRIGVITKKEFETLKRHIIHL